jgi:hypothetical protein
MSFHCLIRQFTLLYSLLHILLMSRIVSALNSQFHFVGAMENWGLVTYRETCLLVDPENTSAVRKQWIALVVGHELAHQWFGNLVTMVGLDGCLVGCCTVYSGRYDDVGGSMHL